MNRYQMAKLVSWAGRLDTRKRLQKVVFMLQAAGCPLGSEFYLHHYGPYSDDIARLADEMVRNNLLSEEAEGEKNVFKYSYRLPDAVRRQLDDIEATEQGKFWAAELTPYEARAKEWLEKEVWQLEYASTILFFKQQGHDWDLAVQKAENFKGTEQVRQTLALARQCVQASI